MMPVSPPLPFSLFRERFIERGIAIINDEGDSPSAHASPRSVFVCAAQSISAQTVNEVLTLSGGLTFVAIGQERARAFLLEPMGKARQGAVVHTAKHDSYAMCTSVEAREGVTTGISAADRAVTIGILGEPQPQARKLVRPGHIFPVETKPGGLLVKHSLCEGAVDLVRAAGFTDAALVVDILDHTGETPTHEAVQNLSAEKNIPYITLTDLTRMRLEHEGLVERVAEARIPTHAAGEVRVLVYRSTIDGQEHLAIVKGTLRSDQPILVRVQTELTFGDLFDRDVQGSRGQIERSLKALETRGAGVLVYLRRSFGVPLGTSESVATSALHQRPTWMMREYGLGAQILRDLGIRRAEVLTSSRRNLVGLTSFGIEIVAQTPIPL